MKLNIVVIGAAAFGLLTVAGAARAMPAASAGVVAGGNANLVQAHYSRHERVIYRCPRYGYHTPYGYERGRYGYYNEGRYPRGYAYGEEGGRYFRYGARHAGSRAFVESRETVSGRRVMTERNEMTTIGRSATKSKPAMEKEQGKAASPVTKGKSEEGRSASPGSAMSKKAMPRNEQPSTTEKGGGPKKGSM